jgi:hypothetical protein
VLGFVNYFKTQLVLKLTRYLEIKQRQSKSWT